MEVFVMRILVANDICIESSVPDMVWPFNSAFNSSCWPEVVCVWVSIVCRVNKTF